MQNTPNIAEALTLEHETIDGGIEAFMADQTAKDKLLDSFESLKRHIYIEEEFVFPKLKEAGLFMALHVMHREHGEIWRGMQNIEQLVAEKAAMDETLAACSELMSVIDSHNEKEEPVIYPHIAADLEPEEAQKLAEFMDGGQMPEGFTPKNL